MSLISLSNILEIKKILGFLQSFCMYAFHYTDVQFNFLIIVILLPFLGGFMFSGHGASHAHFSWICLCYNGNCWRCQPLHQAPQSIGSRRSIHNCGEGNVIVHLVVYNEVFCLLLSSWLGGFLVIFRTPCISYIGSNQRWSVHPYQLKWNSLISGQIKQLLKRIWSTKHSNYIAQQLYNLRHSLSTFN